MRTFIMLTLFSSFAIAGPKFYNLKIDFTYKDKLVMFPEVKVNTGEGATIIKKFGAETLYIAITAREANCE